MKVLLVEPEFKRSVHSDIRPPVSLMKISSYHKELGDEVVFSRGFNYFDTYIPDRIYITTLFTWDYNASIETILSYKKKYPDVEIKVGGVLATLMPDKIEKATGIRPHIGLWEEVEHKPLDYSIAKRWADITGRTLDYSITYATRGCIRKCPFCMVWRHEPTFILNEDWEKMINPAFKKVEFWDNNFFACYTMGGKHKEFMFGVIERLHKMVKNKMINSIEFNQALDARIFNEEIAEAMKGLPMHPLTFAFDGMHEDKFVQNACNIAMKNGLDDISILMLYNFTDTPQDMYYRMKEMVKIGSNIMSFPMKYQKLDSTDRSDFISENWGIDKIEGFNRIRNEKLVNGIIRMNNVEQFEEIFGKTDEEFVKKIEFGKMVKDKSQLDLKRWAK